MADLQSLNFDNRFTRELPADENSVNSRRQVYNACYSRVLPTAVAKPQTIAWSREAAEILELDMEACESQEFADVFGGNVQLEGMDPFAMCYGGHQFGNWAGQLGDGRAINLGEVVNSQNEHWFLQLKGAGPTPYSRSADGLAVLRSSLREFLCSEAMHHLGVPTTRALSLVLTGEEVLRDMFYDGNPKMEPGAVVCRVAKSFTRLGNFQIFAARNDLETLEQLVDFTIRHDFPHLGEPTPETRLAWFDEVCRTTADMLVHWMRVGFVHGVMNTDNMSILGETIDYGPYGWLEDYDPNWTPNTTDAQGRRYRFGNQPGIAQWNLFQFGNAIVQLTQDPEPLEDSLQGFATRYDEQYRTMFNQKLGLSDFQADTDDELRKDLLETLQLVETDMTIFFRKLADFPAKNSTSEVNDDGRSTRKLLEPIHDAFYKPEELASNSEVQAAFASWLKRYRQRVQLDGTPDAVRRERMNAVNPKYVLRNYMAQLAIDQSEEGDFSRVHELLDVLRNPYDEQPGKEEHAQKRPDWARDRAGCSMLSCSS